mmetsp:Transcript_11902/g.1788  ORF Transcript_11902/g.1788 Transcript_11902/m.1788 type:complete len:113 (+) Transcript_11902:54-392(+)
MKGLACVKFTFDVLEFGYDIVGKIVMDKPHLDSDKLKEKIYTDVFENCYKKITKEDMHKFRVKVDPKAHKEHLEYMDLDPNNYNTEEDLIVPQSHIRFRNEIEEYSKTPQPV